MARFKAAGGVSALFGPSGAGETTIINMIAVLVKPDRGRIVLQDEVLVDTAAWVDVPVHRRRIGCVFQDGRLFPHLSVARNLDYGRWISVCNRIPLRPRILSNCWRYGICSSARRENCPAANASALPLGARC